MRWANRGLMKTAAGIAFAFATMDAVPAIDLEKETAVRLAPEDADVFVDGIQLRKQWKRFTESKLYQDVSKVSIVAKLIDEWRDQWEVRDGQIGQLRQAIENPNVESLLKLAQDMFSEEAFFLMDGQASEMILALQSLSDEVTAVASEGDPQAVIDFLMQLPKAEVDAIPVVTAVAGFKISDKERVLGKIDELEAFLRFGLGNLPATKSFIEGLERFEDQRGVRLTWTIIPEMIPWSQIRRNIAGNEAGQVADKLQELLAERQVCFTVGQLDEYLVFALSEEPEAIAKLGKEGSLLKHPDMNLVRDKANEDLVSISYVSDAYSDAYFQAQLKNFFFRQFSGIVRTMQGTLGDRIPKELESLPDDLAWIDEQIDEHVPDFQGQTAVSFLTKSGSELWNQVRTENVVFDASKPLDVLQHVGGDPIAMLAFRLQDRPEYFATARRIVRKAKEYLDLLPQIDELDIETREAWRVGLDRGWPLIVQIADIWEKQFLPAMSDGQHAWTLCEGNLASDRWWKGMPPSKIALPIPEMAEIAGLSDKQRMSDAWSSLFEVFDEGLELTRQYKPEAVPNGFSLPKPTPVESKIGDKYTMPIPEECPVPKNLLPQVVLTDKYMISTYSDQQSETLAKTQELAIAKGVIRVDQACSGVAYLDLGRLIQFATPWVSYAIDNAGGSDRMLIQAPPVLPAVKGSDLLELWQAFGSAGQIASVTTQNANGVAITRTVFTQP